jgi:hypothetical protein
MIDPIPENLTNDKVSAKHIRDIASYQISSLAQFSGTGRYCFPQEGLEYDFVYFKRAQSIEPRRLFVFFSGFADRRTFELPVFHRWSWHDQFPGDTLFISDPALKRSETLGLGWYIGLRNTDVMQFIIQIANDIAYRTGLDASRIVFYGSSGGGFASLRALSFLPEASAIVINPQLRLTRFVTTSLADYLRDLWDGMTPEDFAAQYRHLDDIGVLSDSIMGSRIVYAQNKHDTHHIEKHLPILFEKVEGSFVPRRLKNIELVMFEDARGHSRAEPNSLVPTLVGLL